MPVRDYREWQYDKLRSDVKLCLGYLQAAQCDKDFDVALSHIVKARLAPTPAPSGEAAAKQWLVEKGIYDQLAVVRFYPHQRQWLYEILAEFGDRCRREGIEDLPFVGNDSRPNTDGMIPSEADAFARGFYAGIAAKQRATENAIAALTPSAEPQETK